MDGHRHTRRRSSLPNAPVANAGKRRPEPIQVVHVPAPSLGAAMPTPPPSADSKLPTKEMAELDIGDRPPTPAPSPTPDRKRPDLTPEPDEQTNGSPTDALVEKGKARARDGELVGPDLRREGSFGDSGTSTQDTFSRGGLLTASARSQGSAITLSTFRQIPARRVPHRAGQRLGVERGADCVTADRTEAQAGFPQGAPPRAGATRHELRKPVSQMTG